MHRLRYALRIDVKKLRLWLRAHVYYLLLILVFGALFSTNFRTSTVVSADKTVFAFLQKSALLTPFPVFTFLFPLLCLLVGSFGMLVLLEHIRLHEKKRLMAFVGGIAYILNPLTLAIIREPYTPALWFIALLPWVLWTYIMVLCDTEEPAGKKLFLLAFANVVISPAFTDYFFFITYLLTLTIINIGLVFSPYFFKAVWRSPWLILLVLLLQLPWLVPFIMRIYEAPPTDLFTPLRSLPLPLLTDTSFLPYLFFAAAGLFLLQRYYALFLLLAGVCVSLWLPLPPIVLQLIKPYTYYFLIPLALVLGYYTAAGVSLISILINASIQFFHKKRPRHESLWHSLHGRTPYDVYQELIHLTEFDHGAKYYTPLQFTEHFLQHILNQAHHQIQKRNKQKNMVPRVAGYIAFTLIVICAFPAFRGSLFGSEYLVHVSPPMAEVMQQVQNLNTNRIGYVPSGQPSGLELKTALERENGRILEAVIAKYMLSSILVDASHLLPSQMAFIQKHSSLQLEKKADDVFVFRVKAADTSNLQFLLADTIPNVGPLATGIHDDIAYRNHGLYITNTLQPYTGYYPFLGLKDKKFTIGAKTTSLEALLDEDVMQSLDRYELESGTEAADITVVDGNGQTTSLPATLYPELIGNRMILTMNNQRLRYFEPGKIDSKESSLETFGAGVSQENNPQQTTAENDVVLIETQTLAQRYGYLLQFVNTNKSTRQFNIEVYDRNRIYKYEDALLNNGAPLLLQPALEQGSGYIFAVTPRQFKSLSIYYLPYLDIIGTRFINTKELTKRAHLKKAPTSSKLTAGLYEIYLPVEPTAGETLLYLEQYATGWRLYQHDPDKVNNALESLLARWLPFIYGKEYGTHVAVNNWANGWVLQGSVLNNTLTLVDVPRYISYASWVVVGILIVLFGLGWFVSWYRRLE